MTVPVPGSLIYSYDEDGSTTVFPYPVRFLEPQELTVIREVAGVQTVLAYSVDYTVSGAGNPSGGSIVRTAVTNGGKIIIARYTAWKQIVDLEDKARNPAEAVELQLDRLAMAGQDTNERLAGKADAAYLAPVAFSGDYDDLENRPVIPPGTVTSVGLSAPTGFTVAGSPVIGSGTLSFSYSTGFQAYTAAEASKLAGIQAGAQVNAVASVAGKTGAVTLVKADVGLGSVDNTSDADKPVSSAAQSALDAKVDKAIAITAGAGLTGGGALDASRTIALSSASQAAIAAAQTAVQPGSLGDLAAIDLPPSPSGLVLGDGGTWVLPAGGGDMLSSVYDPQGRTGDAFSRANHTGTQAISTVSGLQSALDAKADDADLAGKFDIPTGTTSQYIRGDGSRAAFPTIPPGTVTSVGLSAPTGFSVSGSPVTNSGTLTLAYASGYTGFTTTLKNKLDGIEAGAQVNTVTSVAGKTGAVTLAKGDVGLGNVDNTADANKPVSSAQATAINAKVTKANDTGLGGFTATSKNLGNLGAAVTIAPTNGNIQHGTNNAAVTITAPSTAGVYTIIIEIVNSATAGAVTLAGFTKTDGDAFTVTSGHKFQVYVAKTNSAVTATVKALQ